MSWSYGTSLIKGADQVIAIQPRAFDLVVPVIAEGLGKAHHVHPVARPMLSEMRRMPADGRPGVRKLRAIHRERIDRLRAGVGGRPVRVKLSRRISVRAVGLAGRAAVRPSSMPGSGNGLPDARRLASAPAAMSRTG